MRTFLLLIPIYSFSTQTPYAQAGNRLGALKVVGTQLSDAGGNPLCCAV